MHQKEVADSSDNDDEMKNFTENWIKCLYSDDFLNEIKDIYLK